MKGVPWGRLSLIIRTFQEDEQEREMQMITTILWDVDGTLLDFQYSQRHALAKCFQTAGLTMTEDILARYSEINDRYWKRLELGEITKQQLLTGRFRTLFEECGIEGVDLDAFLREYQEGLGNIFCYIDDSITICKSLQGKVKQYVITNGVTSTQKNKLQLSGLAACMEELFISEEIGTPKPGKAFFDACLARVEEKDKRRILVVGDSLSSDIKGGVLAGLKTCWYRPEGAVNHTEYQADYQISDLHQIMDVLTQQP